MRSARMNSADRKPALARDCRVYIYHTALRLGLPIKGAGLPEGIEIFPRQDEIGPDEFGNALRAPLGIHRGAKESRGWRFWFYNATTRSPINWRTFSGSAR